MSLAALPSPGFGEALDRLAASIPRALDGVFAVLADTGRCCWPCCWWRGRRCAAGAPSCATRCWPWWWPPSFGCWWAGWPPVRGPTSGRRLRSAEPPPWYPSPRVALPAAVVITASPHLSLPARRLGRRLIARPWSPWSCWGDDHARRRGRPAGGDDRRDGGPPRVRVVRGAARPRRGPRRARRARRLGTCPRRCRPAAGRRVPRSARVRRGEPLVVKVYGRDAHDTALVSTLWRTVWYRDAGAAVRARPARAGRARGLRHLLAAPGRRRSPTTW